MIDTWWQWISAIVIQSSILILALALLDRLIGHRIWPQIRLLLWALILLKLVLPPGLSSPVSLRSQLEWIQENAFRQERAVLQQPDERAAFQWPAIEKRETEPPLRTEAGPATTRDVTPVDSDTEAAPMAVFGSTSVPTPAFSWQLLLFTLWLLGVIAFLGISIWRFRKVRRTLLSSCREVSNEIKDEIRDASKLAGISTPPAPILSESMSSPAVFGIFRPVIVLPRAFSKLNATDRRNVLVHELLHIRRKDLLLQRIVLGLQIIYWFNPLLILVRKKIQHLQELCCDAAAARKLEHQTDGYRETLVRVSRKWISDESFDVGQMALLEDRSRILQRLIWLERSWWKYRRTGLVFSSLAAVLFLAAVIPMAAESEQKPHSFTMVRARTFQPTGSGNTYLMEISVTFQREDGASRHFSTVYRDGRPLLRPPRLRPDPPRVQYCESLPESPNYIGEADVDGLNTLVVGRSGRGYVETYYAPELGCREVRSFAVSNTGLYENRMIALREGIAAAGAFKESPIPPEQFTGEPHQIRQLEQTYPSVLSLIAEYERKYSDLPSFDEYVLERRNELEALTRSVPELAETVEPFEYPFMIRLNGTGQVGPDGSLYFSAQGSSEIHRCRPNGEIVESYYLGTREAFYDAETFVPDAEGRLHVILGYTLDGKFAGWKLRRFESPEIYDEFSFDEQILRPQSLRVDPLGNYYFLDRMLTRNPDSQLYVRWYSPVGTRLGQFQIDSSLLPNDLIQAGIPMKWDIAVPEPGRVLLLLNYWERGQGPFVRRARLYSLDFNRQTITDVTPASPDDRSLLTDLHQYQDEIVLEWSEYQEDSYMVAGDFRGIAPPPFGGRKILTRLGEPGSPPLLEFDGDLIAYSPSSVIVQKSRPREGPLYFRIPIQ